MNLTERKRICSKVGCDKEATVKNVHYSGVVLWTCEEHKLGDSWEKRKEGFE